MTSLYNGNMRIEKNLFSTDKAQGRLKPRTSGRQHFYESVVATNYRFADRALFGE
jgi:hypothetical protein